jgi:hypothetical protein
VNFIELDMKTAIEEATASQQIQMLYLLIENNPAVATSIINAVLESEKES